MSWCFKTVGDCPNSANGHHPQDGPEQGTVGHAAARLMVGTVPLSETSFETSSMTTRLSNPLRLPEDSGYECEPSLRRGRWARDTGVRVYAFFAGWDASAADPVASQSFQPTAQDKIVPAGAKVELLWNEGEFTEGPAPAADGAILFSDIGNRILRYDPRSGKTTVFRDPSGKSNGLKFDPRGQPRGLRRGGAGGQSPNLHHRAGRQRRARWPTVSRASASTAPTTWRSRPTGNVYFTDPRYVGDEPRELDFEGVFLVEPARHGARRDARRAEAQRHHRHARRQDGVRGRQQQPAGRQSSAAGVRRAVGRHAGRASACCTISGPSAAASTA